MTYKQCCVCRLSLPANMVHTILASFKGKEIKVDICDRCKEKKIEESKRRPNATS